MRLPRDERAVLAALPGQLRDALAEDEPSVYRLFPPAFQDDPAANLEYHGLVGESLLDGKLEALRELERTAHAEHLSEPELECWLGAIESLRLVLGTQLDVSDETYARFDPSDAGGTAARPLPLALVAPGGGRPGARRDARGGRAVGSHRRADTADPFAAALVDDVERSA